MSKIETIDQLREEIQRLKLESKAKEEKIRQEARMLLDELKPQNILINTLSSLTGIEINSKEFLKDGLAVGLSLVLQRFIFKTQNKVERKIYSWIDEIFDRVKYFINKFSSEGSVHSERIEKED